MLSAFLRARVLGPALGLGILLAPSVAAATPPSWAQSDILSAPIRKRLENGLTVLISPSRHAPTVAMRLDYDAGEREDAPGHPGVAALTFRSMLDGTKHLPQGAYAEHLRRIGATSVRDEVRDDTAAVATSVTREAMETVLWMWSDQMAFAGPAIDDASLARARDRLATDRRAIIDDVPGACIGDYWLAALYPPEHPYRHLPVATREQLDLVTTADAKAFYARHYAPNQAILTIVGDVDPATTMELVRRYFGDIPAGPRLTHSAEPVHLQGTTTIDLVAGIDTAQAYILWPTAPFLGPDDAELDVVARLLQGNNVALLGWSLIGQKKLATTINAWQSSRQLGSVFTIRVVGKPGVGANELVAAVDETLAGIDEKAVQDNLTSAINDHGFHQLLDAERAAERATTIAGYQRTLGEPGTVMDLLRRIGKLKPPAILDTISRQLPRDRRIVVRVRPQAGAPRCGTLAPRTSGGQP
jgi:zinc protease